MLFAAFAAGAAGVAFGSTAIALLLALGTTVVLSWLHGVACVSHRGDQVVSGVAVNIIAVGMTAVLGIAWFAQGGQTPPVTTEVRLQAVLPRLAGWFKGIPVLGSIVGDGLLSHNIMVYATLALVPAVWWLLYRTRFGLRLRAVGENAHMVDAAGRVGHAHAVCGAHAQRLVVRAGRQLPGAGAKRRLCAQHDGRARLHGAGRDDLRQVASGGCVLGLPVVRFPGRGGDSPAGRAAARHRRGAGAGGAGLPYLLTVILLAGFIGRTVAPQALGRPYVKDRS
jgi:ABC-type uncharacterized transport system permease subunit